MIDDRVWQKHFTFIEYDLIEFELQKLDEFGVAT